ncbi:MAG: glutamate-ammonia-ligase adenylyltransferase, partial [Desulfurobacterium sp.]
GEKGELIFSTKYFKEYTEKTARTWERLAFTRFRFLRGNLREEAEEIVKEFLFGKPLDGKTLQEVLSMRERLEKELGKGRDDIKYSAGGVVDLEFVGYIYQLYASKKLGNTLRALEELSTEVPQFKKLAGLYRKIREAETEKRLFGNFINYSDRIVQLKEETRKGFREFVEWIKRRV